MIAIACGAALLARAVNPEIWDPVRIPWHAARGGGLADSLLRAFWMALCLVKWLAVPLAVLANMDSPWAAIGAGAGLVGVAAGLRFANPPPRSTAAPLAADALWLLCAAIAATYPVTVPSGVVFGVVEAVVVLGVVALRFGRYPVFAMTWRPWFRVNGDNPDVAGATALVRIPGDLTVEIEDQGASFTSLSVVSLGHGPVAGLDSTVLRPLLERNRKVRVRIGQGGGADVDLAVPPGRYLVTVRDYEVDRHQWRVPTVIR